MRQAPTQAQQTNPPLVRLENIGKAFGEAWAVRDVTLDIEAGKITALLGENGAGKSTLMNILSGRFPPSVGKLYIDGRETRLDSPADSIRLGIGMVHQHFMLIDSMSIARNITLGTGGGLFLRPAARRREVLELSERFGIPVNPDLPVGGLSMGERQNVEILKLLMRDSRVLIFDEPTSVISPPEAERLFEVFRTMTAMGKAVVFISHKLEEVMRTADTCAVLHKGRITAVMPRSEVKSRDELASLMVGRPVVFDVQSAPVPKSETVLNIAGLHHGKLKDFSLDLRMGEILAVVGVAGNGQKELVDCVVGMSAPKRGRIEILRKPWREFHAAPPVLGGLCWIPEDRLGFAVCKNLKLVDNVLLTTRRLFSKGPRLLKKDAAKTTRGLMRRFHVQPLNPELKAADLSGGNLQKLVLAREFLRKPRLIVADQPTQGLDVSATEEIRHRLLNIRSRAGVLLITGDLEEALQIADRIAVLHDGRLMDVFDAKDEVKVAGIGSLMAGIASSAGITPSAAAPSSTDS